MSTNAYRCIEWLIENNIFPDRVIILSDMQCWDDTGFGNNNLQKFWNKYQKSGGKNVWLHSVHLNGYGDSPFDTKGKKLNKVSGFSEKIIQFFCICSDYRSDTK